MPHLKQLLCEILFYFYMEFKIFNYFVVGELAFKKTEKGGNGLYLCCCRLILLCLDILLLIVNILYTY